MNIIRVYNVSAETTGEGFPVSVDYNGETYVFQPSDCFWDRKTITQETIDTGAGVKLSGIKKMWAKDESKTEWTNYCDVPSDMCSWLFEVGQDYVHHNVLKSGAEMEDIVAKRLAEKEAQLAEIEKKIEITEKKAKRGRAKPSSTEA